MPSIGTHLLSGALSGLASTVFLQPFDLLKTRQQQLHPSPSPSPSSTVTATRQRPPNVPALARAVLAAEGPRGLWRGTAASLARNVPGIAMYMAGLTHLRALMARTTAFRAAPAHSTSSASAITTLPTLSPAGNMLAGAATRVAVGFVLNPISVLKARYESSLHTLPSLPSALLSLFKAGPRELTRGFAASAVRDAPYAGLFVVSYEGIKRRMGEVGLHSSVVHTTSAAVAGTFATLATHPFDVIKTKIQVRSEAQYRGLLGTVSTILQTRGVAGFFDGASLRLSRKVLSSAIGWGVYEGVLIMSRRL